MRSPLIWRPLLLISGLIAAGTMLRLVPDGARGVLDRYGAHDEVPFVLLAAALCAVGMPRQVVAYAAGYSFGPWTGAGLALAAQVLGCFGTFAWARLLGRAWAERMMRRRLGGRLARADAFLSANPFASTLMLRLLPVGNNTILNMLAGVSGVSARPFLLGSAVGFVPQTIVFAILGAGTRVDEATQIALGAGLFAGSAALGVVLMRRFRDVTTASAVGRVRV